MSSVAAGVTIVGAGVSGLTTAICLGERGFAVTVVARELTERTTSSVPGAMWFPYKVRPVSRTLDWARVSLERFAELARDPATGVRFCRGVELLRDPVERPWWAAAVESFERVPADQLPAGWKVGFAIDAPVIETPRYLPWLTDRARRAGVRIEQREVTELSELVTSGAGLVVNCSGLGARELASDPEVYPSRGQLVHVEPKAGLDRYLLDESSDDAITYVVPRSDAIVLGSTLGDGDTRLEVDERDTRDILRRATALVPEIAGRRVLGAVVGLRPCRSEVRLEREHLAGGTVIHNYGHGGAGFTLSWGCAREVADLATGG